MGLFSWNFKGIAKAVGRKVGGAVRSVGTKVAEHTSSVGNKVKKMGDLWKPTVPRGGLGEYKPVYLRGVKTSAPVVKGDTLGSQIKKFPKLWKQDPKKLGRLSTKGKGL